MDERDRTRDEGQRLGAPTPEDPAARAATEAGERARALTDEGEAAIERALSQDSARFLRDSRQHGGQ